MADRALEIVSMKNPADIGLDPSLLEVGDKIIEVAGEHTIDQLDFFYHAAQGDVVSLKVERKDGRVEDVVVSGEAVDGLEILFKAMDFRRCRCKCPFCFVDQMPKGLRKSLYIKDEDFRLSFLYGNYTTMNDITDAELEKIIGQRNSPQWVSVHVIDEDARRFIFGRPMKRDIVDTLTKLAEGGIAVHTQAVIVAGKNDGEYLRETIETLEAIHPNILTLAVVPVGLTKHRKGLAPVRTLNQREMEGVLDQVEPYRTQFLSSGRKSRFVFPSDELYLGTDREVPDHDSYEHFPQLDNGVGTIRHLVSEVEEDLETFGAPKRLDGIRIVTGRMGEVVFSQYVFPLLQAGGVQSLPELVGVENVFFGSTVTCSGLLVAEDMIDAVKKRSNGGAGDKVTMIPANCINHEGVTIDGMDVGAISSSLGGPVVAGGESFVESLHACLAGTGDGL